MFGLLGFVGMAALCVAMFTWGSPGVLVGSLMAGGWAWFRTSRYLGWRSHATARGLKMGGGGWPRALLHLQMQGEVDGRPVVARETLAIRVWTSRRVSVRATGPIGPISMRWEIMTRMDSGPVVKTGDLQLDRSGVIRGDETEVRARMHAAVREPLARAMWNGPGRVADGAVTFTRSATASGAGLVAHLVDVAASTVDGLALKTSVVEQLAANVASDPLRDVRAANLRLLLREHADTDACARALADARNDADAGIRLSTVLHDIAEYEALDDPELLARLAGLATETAATKDPRFLGLLRRVPFAVAEAGFIGVALTQEAAHADRVAAMELLGEHGGSDAIVALNRLVGSRAGGRIKNAARSAIARIRGRQGGPAHGQLTLAEAEDGQLSIAEDEAGALSVVED